MSCAGTNSWTGSTSAASSRWIQQSMPLEVYMYLWRCSKGTTNSWLRKRYGLVLRHFVKTVKLSLWKLFQLTCCLFFRCGNLHCNTWKTYRLLRSWKDQSQEVYLPCSWWSWPDAWHGIWTSDQKNCGSDKSEYKWYLFIGILETNVTVKWNKGISVNSDLSG